MKTHTLTVAVLTFIFGSVTSTASAQWNQWGQSQPQQIPNPFCSAPTYIVAHEPRNAGINFDNNGNYYITVSRNLTNNQANVNAMLAHECGHVVNNHGRGYTNQFQVKNMELQADCHAARALKQRQDNWALRAFEQFVGSCGNYLSGPMGYPTCNERLRAIRSCSAG